MSLAEKLHAAFVAYWPDAPTFADWPKQGASWYTLASMRDELLEPPETLAPYDHDLTTAIAPRLKPGTDIVVKETLPTSLHIRPQVARDLCLREWIKGGNLYEFAKQARVHGITVAMLEDRLDPVDQELGVFLIRDATGPSAAHLILITAIKIGLEIPDAAYDESLIWQSVAYAMFVDDEDDHRLVTFRTPGLGTVKVGPYRAKHKRIWEDTAEKSDEWSGRLAVLASLTGKTLRVIEESRVEDVVRGWSAFQDLKKNASDEAHSRFTQIHSARSSATAPSTSTDGPTPNLGAVRNSLTTSEN